MAKIAGNFKDSIVVIYDNNNNYVAQTIITEHDKREMLIEIPDSLDNIKSGTRLNVLIIHTGGVSEFGGVLRRTSRGACEISLFGERQREGRSATRHILNVPGQINNLIINNKPETLQSPLNVIVENLSSTGVLINSRDVRLETGFILQIELNIHGKEAIIFGNVVRERRNADETFSYGCHLIFL